MAKTGKILAAIIEIPLTSGEPQRLHTHPAKRLPMNDTAPSSSSRAELTQPSHTWANTGITADPARSHQNSPNDPCATASLDTVGATPLFRLFSNLRSGSQQIVVTYGTSLTASGSWVPLLQAWFHEHYPGLIKIANTAQNGRDSNWGVMSLRDHVIQHKPDVVFLEFSANDAATHHHISIRQSEDNLDAMVTAIQAANPKTEVILMTMSDVIDVSDKKPAASTRPNLSDYYAVYTAYAKSHNLVCINHYADWHALKMEDSEKFLAYAPDGLHPNDDGIEAITWPNIRKILSGGRHASAAR
jgi:acyl-CoA thioesterase I